MKNRKDFTVIVYGEKWKVKYVGSIVEEGHKAVGVCDAETKIIRIDKSLSDELTAITFFHELFHAYFRRMGMINSDIHSSLEELMADQFATIIAENFSFDF